MSLELQDVSFHYPGNKGWALVGLSLKVEPGQSLALVGANGAGKSTLLSLVCGKIKPNSGTVRADERDLTALGAGERSHLVAFLPQSERVPFDFTCHEFVLFGTTPQIPTFSFPGPEEAKRAQSALEKLGVGNLAERPVTEVSGGELQLVRIARAVVQNTPWVILDEPTAMLDPAHAHAVGLALRQLVKDGKGIIFSTHDLSFASRYADTILVIKSGRVLALGNPTEALDERVLKEAFGVPFEKVLVQTPKEPSGA